MKKLLSLLLCLMMVMSCAAMAETAVEMQTMISPNGDYSFDVPADFFSMDGRVLTTIFSTPEMQQALAQAMGLQDASQLAVYFETMKEANMMIVYGADMVSNFNIQVTPSDLTMELVAALKAMMDNAMAQQFQTLGIAAEDIHPMEIQQIGKYSWYGNRVVMMGLDVYSMMTIEDGVQYTITLTALEDAVMQNVLESFTVTAPAAQ